MQKEIWKDVVGYEEYFMVSSTGRVWSKRTEKLLAPTQLKSGYLVINSKIGGRNGKAVSLRIHRLVAEAFLSEPEKSISQACSETLYGKVPVNHKDGDKKNNCVENLEWCTYSYNTRHAIQNGFLVHKKGFENSLSKLTEEQVLEIKSCYVANHKIFGTRALAKKYNVHHTTISRIVRNNAPRS